MCSVPWRGTLKCHSNPTVPWCSLKISCGWFLTICYRLGSATAFDSTGVIEAVQTDSTLIRHRSFPHKFWTVLSLPCPCCCFGLSNLVAKFDCLLIYDHYRHLHRVAHAPKSTREWIETRGSDFRLGTGLHQVIRRSACRHWGRCRGNLDSCGDSCRPRS